MKVLLITKLFEQLRSSLWFVPAISAVTSFSAARALMTLDHRIEQTREAWFLFDGAANSAQQLLSTIAASMITFTGLVFSITILVLQLASNQFSPRVLRTFLEDKTTKIAMAAFVATFVFAMTILPEVGGENGGEAGFVPALSIYAAFALVLLSVGIFIRFIDHMAHSVRAITIIKRVAAETHRSIARAYPEDEPKASYDSTRIPSGPPSLVLMYQRRSGVLSAVDEEGLMHHAKRARAVVALVPMAGDFVPHGAPLFRVWCDGAPPSSHELEEALLIADERSPHQDPAFGFRQLVDIAERALSPSMNDPSTAVQALDEIHDLLRLLAQRPFPSTLRFDENGELRLIVPHPDWEAYVRLGLDEIRQYGGQSIQVARRMRALLEDCRSVARPERRAALEQQIGLLEEATQRNMKSKADRAMSRRPSMSGHGHA